MTCTECDGKGEVMEMYISDDGCEHEQWYMCNKCGGTGEIPIPTAVANVPENDWDTNN